MKLSAKAKVLITIVLFLIMNAVKITVFNMFILPSNTIEIFLYKLAFTLLFIIIIYLLLFRIKSKIPFVIFYIIQTIYIFVNLVFYDYFHSYLHISQAFALFGEGVGVAADLTVLINSRLLLVLLDIPFLILVLFMYPRITAFIKNIKLRFRLAIVFLCLLAVLSIEFVNYTHKYSIIDLVKPNLIVSDTLMVQRYGTLTNSLVDIVVNNNGKTLLKKLTYGKTLTSKGTDAAKPNFVVLEVESMDSNSINKIHDGQYVMPFIHSLATQNVYYPYTLSYHEAGGTSDAEFSTFNSVEPLDNYPSIGINYYDYPNSLVTPLLNNSYSTAAFHGNVGNYFNRDISYPKMGFQEFFDIAEMSLKNEGWGASDEKVYGFAQNYIKSISQPFFSFIITLSSHGPFTNASHYYNNKIYNDVTDSKSKDYMNSMSYVDLALKNYISYIQANYKNTYILIWGDHTPSINEKSYHQASFTEGDKYFEFVPIIIVTPDGKKYTEDKIVASFLDISPTILNASGVPYTIKSAGIDLLNRTDAAGDIPYRDSIFSRSDLYDKVSQISP